MKTIRQIRRSLKLTQRQLASELGLAKNGNVTIRRIEKGQSSPSGLIQRCFEFFYFISSDEEVKKKYEKFKNGFRSNE